MNFLTSYQFYLFSDLLFSGANQPGADVCLNVGAGPCGKAPAGTPVAAWVPRQEGWSHLLKNLDHYNAAAPGNFSAFLWDSDGKSTFLGSTRDLDNNGAVYTIHHTVPDAPEGNVSAQDVLIATTALPFSPFVFRHCLRPLPYPPSSPQCLFLQYILQTIYFPNNAAAPPAFYQCSDVEIIHPNTTKVAHHH